MKFCPLLFLVISACFLSSCIENKFVFKGNYVATIKTKPTDVIPTDSLYIYKVSKGFKTKIDNKGDYLVVKQMPKGNLRLVKSVQLLGSPTSWKKDMLNRYYFPECDSFPQAKKLTYFDTKPVLQAVSIPLKIRPRLTAPALRDSFPSQAETYFNVAVSVGWKLNLNSFGGTKKDIFGRNLQQVSLTPGFFLGTGATDLRKANTRNPIITFERRAPIVSYGCFIMLGYNNINIGYSFGFDHAFGIGSNGWLYQGRMWHGISLGFDIIR